ncbi:MAG: outer membrane beta-barrel protein [Flavobacteriales bacterium]|nr:outer membrane beta-barrel protein [Flavobacteriales bacterium]
MRLEKALLLLSFCFPLCFFAQSTISIESNGKWLFSNYFGYATIELEDTFKSNSTVYGGFIGKEFKIKESFSIASGIEHLRINTDYITSIEQLHTTFNFIQLPVQARLKYQPQNQTDLYFDIGIYGSYLYNSKVENILLNVEDNESDLGFNFGVKSSLGLIHNLNSNLYANLGISSQADLFQSYKNDNLKLKIKDLYAFHFGVGINL